MIPLKDIGVRMIHKSVKNYFPTLRTLRNSRSYGSTNPIWSMLFNIPNSEFKIKGQFVRSLYPEYYPWRTMIMEIQFSYGYRSELSKLDDSRLGIFVFKGMNYKKDNKILELRSDYRGLKPI